MAIRSGTRWGAYRTRILLAGVVSSAFPLASAVAAEVDAEADADADRYGLADIVVTAERREGNIQKTPIAITAFDESLIKQQDISTFRDLSGRIPGLLAPKRSTAYTTQTYAMRGIGETDTFPEPTVAVYVDDVYLARTVGSLYDTPDLERVEVLRGPQGTLYGRNSAAGAIRFITKDPTSEFGGSASLSLGNYDNFDARLRLNGAIVPELLDGSISVIRHTRDGWTHNVTLDDDVNDLDLTVVRGKLKAYPSDRLTLTLSGDAMWDRSTPSYYAPVYQPDGVPGSGTKTNPDRTWADPEPLNKTTVYGGSLVAKYEIDDNFTVKSVTALRGMHGPINYDNDGISLVSADSWSDFKQYYRTQEFTLNGEFGNWNFVAGVYYFYEYFRDLRVRWSGTSRTPNLGQVVYSRGALETESYAAFGQLNYSFDDRWSVTLGGRYTSDDRSFKNEGASRSNVPLVYTPYPDVDAIFASATNWFFTDENADFSAFNPKVSVQYQHDPNLLLYASYSQGFKSGGFDIRATTVTASINPYRPQTTTAYEVGVKAKLFDNTLVANLAVFYNEIEDFHVRASDLVTRVTQLLNAGDGHTQGFELELSALPTQRLRFGASVAYLETKYDTFTATLPGNTAGRTTLIGLDFPFSPKWQAGFSATWDLPIDTAGVWRVGVDGQYESARKDLYNTPELTVRKQAFFNGSFSYTGEDESWTAGINVKNIFDLRRNQAGGYAPTSGPNGNYYFAYNEPRLINVFIRKNF